MYINGETYICMYICIHTHIHTWYWVLVSAIKQQKYIQRHTHWKGCNKAISIHRWHNCPHLLKLPKLKTMKILNDGQDIEQQELSFIADGKTKHSHGERQFGGFLYNQTHLF